MTAGAGLAHGLGVKLTAPDGPLPVENPDAESLLVWGGASGVGVFGMISFSFLEDNQLRIMFPSYSARQIRWL